MIIATVAVQVTAPSAFLVISSHGGITAQAVGSGSVMDVGVTIDGEAMGNPAQRITIVPSSGLAQGTSPLAQAESWGFTVASGSVAGPVAGGPPVTHTVSLIVRHVSGDPINVGFPLDGGMGPFATSGASRLTVQVINQ
jgi:hypothetical protein